MDIFDKGLINCLLSSEIVCRAKLKTFEEAASGMLDNDSDDYLL